MNLSYTTGKMVADLYLGGKWLWALLRNNVSVRETQVSSGPFSHCVLAYCTVGGYIYLCGNVYI